MFRRLAHLFASVFRRRRLEHDLDDELRASLDLIAARFTAQGMHPADARRAARLEFDGLEQVKENVRDGLIGASLQTLLQDTRYALRSLRRRPSFTVIALLTLALGIGINTAIFSVFYAVLLRPLPYHRPAQLALIWASFRTAGHARAPVSGAILAEIAHRNRSLAGIAGIWTITRTFTGDRPEQVKCARVTTNFFDVLGVDAAQGRTFRKTDSGGDAIMLTDGLFRRRFAGNAGLIGKSVPMDWEDTLVGVLPPDFQLHFAPDSNVPPDVQVFDTFDDGIYADRDQYYIRLVGRLRPGMSLAEGQRDLDRVAAEIRGAYTGYNTENLQFTLARMQADAVRDVAPALAALFAGAGFVLAICCVNIASLLLARANGRRKEMALRLSLGASRGRILRQLLTEGGVLCLLGGAAGVAVGWACFRGLLAIRPARLAQIADAGIRWPALAFAAACSLAAALVLGLVPATETFRLDFMATLRTGSRGWMGRLHRRTGAVLITGEIALGFVLVAGAALTARTLSKIEQVHPGFEPRGLLAFQVSNGIPRKEVAGWEAQLTALPGVERVGAISHLPLDADIPNWYGPYKPEGIDSNQAATLVADLRCATPGYFAAMGARLLAGRYFDALDRAGSREVLIVDDLLARTTWPGQSAIGKTIAAEHMTSKGFQFIPGVVVGVVEHLYNHSLTKRVRGQIYMPFEQSPRAPLSYVVRTQGQPLSLVPAVRRMLHDRSPAAAMAKIRPMTEYVSREISPVSCTAVLAAIFGALALLLAATGVYGVFNYQVSQRRPEMGIRMALGAGTQDVLRMVLREVGVLAGSGVLLGVAATWIAAHWLGTLLYGVTPLDPLSYCLALLFLPGAALIGGWRPAGRAAAANPAELIREE